MIKFDYVARCSFCDAVFYPKGSIFALDHVLKYHSYKVCLYAKLIGEYYFGDFYASIRG